MWASARTAFTTPPGEGQVRPPCSGTPGGEITGPLSDPRTIGEGRAGPSGVVVGGDGHADRLSDFGDGRRFDAERVRRGRTLARRFAEAFGEEQDVLARAEFAFADACLGTSPEAPPSFYAPPFVGRLDRPPRV